MSKEKELLAAIKEIDLPAAQKLIKDGANVNYKDNDKASYGYRWPLLHHCIFKASSPHQEGHLEIASLLLAHGAEIEGANFAGETPALFAVKHFAPDILDLLVTKGANIHAETKQKHRAYDIVLERYYYDQQLDLDHIDEEETEAEKDVIRKGEGGSLAAMFERIDALVKNGYDLEAGKYSAALCAIFEIQQEKLPAKALYYLFDKGADPRGYTTIDENRVPLFEYACSQDLPLDVLTAMAVRIGFEYVFEDFEDYSPLVIAIINGNLELTKKLIALGADIHAQEEDPLYQACSVGNLEIVKYLVEQGADVHYVDKKGKTAIDFAESPEIIEYLKSI